MDEQEDYCCGCECGRCMFPIAMRAASNHCVECQEQHRYWLLLVTASCESAENPGTAIGIN